MDTKASEELKLSDLYGGLLLQNRHPVLKTFLEKEKLIYTGIKENLEKQPASEKNPDTACRSGRHTAL